eukprot:2147014-Rhodomonas_salina.1
MVSGDGENDIPLFESMAAGTKGALVGNAVAGLRDWVGTSLGPERSICGLATRGWRRNLKFVVSMLPMDGRGMLCFCEGGG